jgi:5,10-methylene-tetrahydrofolate dehydrogenase/methenyl tetrahydrofolate cyclohydrolase
MKKKKFSHARLKHSFSQMERDLDLQEIPKLAPLPKKRITKKKAIIVIMKKKDEEGEKAKKVGKIWADGEG